MKNATKTALASLLGFSVIAIGGVYVNRATKSFYKRRALRRKMKHPKSNVDLYPEIEGILPREGEKALIERIKKSMADRNLFLTGDPGSGKTVLTMRDDVIDRKWEGIAFEAERFVRVRDDEWKGLFDALAKDKNGCQAADVPWMDRRLAGDVLEEMREAKLLNRVGITNRFVWRYPFLKREAMKTLEQWLRKKEAAKKRKDLDETKLRSSTTAKVTCGRADSAQQMSFRRFLRKKGTTSVFRVSGRRFKRNPANSLFSSCGSLVFSGYRKSSHEEKLHRMRIGNFQEQRRLLSPLVFPLRGKTEVILNGKSAANIGAFSSRPFGGSLHVGGVVSARDSYLANFGGRNKGCLINMSRPRSSGLRCSGRARGLVGLGICCSVSFFLK